MNTSYQKISRLRIPEAILEGKAEGHPSDPKSLEGQFQRFAYPAPGHSTIKMIYKYGGSHFGTTMESNRLAKAYQSDGLEFVLNQDLLDLLEHTDTGPDAAGLLEEVLNMAACKAAIKPAPPAPTITPSN